MKAFIFAAAAFLFCSPVYSQPTSVVTIRLAISDPPGSAIAEGAETFAGWVRSSLKDRVEFTIVRTPDPLIALREGEAELAAVSTSRLASQTSSPDLGVFDLPFFFEKLSDVQRFEETAVGEIALAGLAREGLIGLAFWNSGMTQLFGKRLESAGDLKGRKISSNRSQPTQAVLAALGASSIGITLAEAPAALETGLLDAVDAPTAYVARGIVPIAPGNVLGTRFRASIRVLATTRETWSKLPHRHQVYLSAFAKEVAPKINASASQNDEDAAKTLAVKGFKFTSVKWEEVAREAEFAWRKVKVIRPEFFEAALTVVREVRETPGRRGSLDPARNVKPILLLFATDRREEPHEEPALRFRGDRGSLQFGIAEYSLDQTRSTAAVAGTMSRLSEIKLLSETDFVSKLESQLASSTQKEALVYIHGYNNEFIHAIAAAAILKDDIRFGGVPVVFSWPSDGSIMNYLHDEDEVRASRNNFQTFLETIKASKNLDKIHIVAHSMGNRLIIEAFDRISAQKTIGRPLATHLILAAPDVFITALEQAASALRQLSARITLYASDRDSALACSSWIHKNRRAGQGGAEILVLPGVDSIDATNVTPAASKLSQLTCRGGHSYVIHSPIVQADVNSVLLFNASPDQRHRLRSRDKSNLKYWEFRH